MTSHHFPCSSAMMRRPAKPVGHRPLKLADLLIGEFDEVVPRELGTESGALGVRNAVGIA